MSEGVGVGAIAATCSRITAETICGIAPNKARDISSVEVSDDVLHRGGSATRPTTGGGGGACGKVTGADPASTRAGGVPVTTYRACVPLETPAAFCLSAD
ncbi:UNVERIFIED_CONTAM: hypothetical protein Slati_3067400 [Sesamum latifolium]|uniref:Uncharacterized protein n=1 Tax=Sesamum latifolium TaxID=2727402 RepID=A0AAW2UST3_9LAMI